MMIVILLYMGVYSHRIKIDSENYPEKIHIRFMAFPQQLNTSVSDIYNFNQYDHSFEVCLRLYLPAI